MYTVLNHVYRCFLLLNPTSDLAPHWKEVLLAIFIQIEICVETE